MQEPSFDAELKLLLIEDNPADARLVQALLAGMDEIAVTWAATLASALEQLRAASFDVVLLDLLLPDARGTDIVASLRAAAPAAAIVVTSGQSADDGLLARAVIRKGAEDLVPKGQLTAELLSRTVSTAVERSRLKAAASRREAALAKALAEARIAHWSWAAGSRMVWLAGHLPGFVDAAADGVPHTARRSVRDLLRRLPSWARHSLYAAWRELSTDIDRLAVVVVEADGETTGRPGDLVIETVVKRDDQGRIRLMDGSVRDASGAAAIERLEGELITHLGHELRTPLTTIRGALGLLANGDDARLSASARTLVGNAIANADRIGRVIGEALQPGTEPPDGLRLQPRRVPLGAFLYDALATRLPTLTAAGITLCLAPGGRTIEHVVDAGRLRRAVDCLCRRLLADCATVAGDFAKWNRFTLGVTTHGGVAWLQIAAVPVEAPGVAVSDRAPHAEGKSQDDRRGRQNAGALPAPAASERAVGCDWPGDPAWRIAVALAT